MIAYQRHVVMTYELAAYSAANSVQTVYYSGVQVPLSKCSDFLHQ